MGNACRRGGNPSRAEATAAASNDSPDTFAARRAAGPTDAAWVREREAEADGFFRGKRRRLGLTRLGCVSLVTWNVQLLPGVCPGQAGLACHLLRRAAAIAGRLLALDRVVDVIVLQECWHQGARDVLIAALRTAYPHVYAPPGRYSGLLVASRKPPLGHFFTRFDATDGVEGVRASHPRPRVAREGTLCAREIRIRMNIRIVFFFLSLAQAWFDKGVTATVLPIGRRRLIHSTDTSGGGYHTHGMRVQGESGDDSGEESGSSTPRSLTDDACVEADNVSHAYIVLLNIHTQSDFWRDGCDVLNPHTSM